MILSPLQGQASFICLAQPHLRALGLLCEVMASLLSSPIKGRPKEVGGGGVQMAENYIKGHLKNLKPFHHI